MRTVQDSPVSIGPSGDPGAQEGAVQVGIHHMTPGDPGGDLRARVGAVRAPVGRGAAAPVAVHVQAPAQICAGRRRRSAILCGSVAGWSSLVARWAHNPKVAGSNPAPATRILPC